MKVELLQEHEKEIMAKVLKVIAGDEIDETSMNYLLNMAAPATEIANQLFELECDALEMLNPETKDQVIERLRSCVSLIAQLSLISGGVNYQDFLKVASIQTRMQEEGKWED